MKQQGSWHHSGMSFDRHISHCRRCGTATELRLPDDGDTRLRPVCRSCSTVHYVNPLNVVGTVPVMGNKVLLCLRNIEPRKGLWTLPAGFMELNETTAEGALRETQEEAGAHIELSHLFSLIDVPRAGQVHFFYRAHLLSTNFDPGHETQRVALFEESEIPWEQIAFTTVRETLKRHFADLKIGHTKGFHQFMV